MTMVVGMFKSLVGAQRAVSELVASRYQRAAISVLVRQSREQPLAAAVANCGTQDRTPWRVLAGGPLAVSLRGSEADVAEDSVAHALSAAGLRQTAARFFADAIAQGAVVVAVHCEDARVRDARDILDLHAEPEMEDLSEFPPPDGGALAGNALRGQRSLFD